MAVKVTYKDDVIATAQNGQTVEIDCEGHKFTENLFVESYGSGGGVAPEVTAEEVTITPTKERQEIMPTTSDYISKAIVEPIPDEYVVPEGELTLAKNGTYPVIEYASVVVNVPEVPEWDGSVSKIVSFTFSGEVHYFEEGTTWGAWLITGYNDDNFEARGDYVAPTYAPTDYYVADSDMKRVKVTDEISSGATYILTNQPTE